MKKQCIRLKLQSYDHILLDKAVKQIVLTAKRTGAQLMGPVPLPNKRRCFTVLRSPHWIKIIRTIVFTTHKRILSLLPIRPWMLMKLNISSGGRRRN
jgi:small subunit ribosomal protein S10